jgi:hypothetical protein
MTCLPCRALPADPIPGRAGRERREVSATDGTEPPRSVRQPAKAQVSCVLAKLGVNNRVQAAIPAHDAGLLGEAEGGSVR